MSIAKRAEARARSGGWKTRHYHDGSSVDPLGPISVGPNGLLLWQQVTQEEADASQRKAAAKLAAKKVASQKHHVTGRVS